MYVVLRTYLAEESVKTTTKKKYVFAMELCVSLKEKLPLS